MQKITLSILLALLLSTLGLAQSLRTYDKVSMPATEFENTNNKKQFPSLYSDNISNRIGGLNFPASSAKEYKLNLQQVDIKGGRLSTKEIKDLSYTYNAIKTVESIQELRESKTAGYYTLQNEVILTYQQNYRGQKYIQDNSAAILIDDEENILTKSYSIYDGITGISGKLSEVNGLMVFTPIIDAPAASSTNNSIQPKTVELKDYLRNPKAYESQLISFKNLNFSDTDGSMTFAKGRDYDATNGESYLSVRTSFYEADYIGSLVPTNPATITGIASHFNNKGQLFIRSKKDILSNKKTTETQIKEKLSIYPNPATDKFYVVGSNKAEVEVFSIIGKQVIRTQVASQNNPIPLHNLKSGVYMVRITQEGAITTKKLIIK